MKKIFLIPFVSFASFCSISLGALTNLPAPAAISIMVDTNHYIVAPTNMPLATFRATNNIAAADALAYVSNNYVSVESDPTLTDDGTVTLGDGTSTIDIEIDAQFTTFTLRFNGVSQTWTLINASEFNSGCQINVDGHEVKNIQYLHLDTNTTHVGGAAAHDVLYSFANRIWRVLDNNTTNYFALVSPDGTLQMDGILDMYENGISNCFEVGWQDTKIEFDEGKIYGVYSFQQGSQVTKALGATGPQIYGLTESNCVYQKAVSLDVVGEAQLGDAATDNHGINTAPVANQMITEDFDTALTAGSEYGRKQTIDHTGNTEIVGTLNRYGSYLDQNSSGTHNQSFSQTYIYGQYIDSADTSTLNNADATMQHYALYVDANGVATRTLGTYTRTAIVGINQGSVAGATKTAGHFTTSGTSAYAYGVRVDASGGTSGNYALWLGNGATAGGGEASFAEDEPFYFGQASDAYIKYDGSDFVLEPDAFGSGKVLIGATGDNYIQAARVYLNAADYLYSDGTSLLWSDN